MKAKRDETFIKRDNNDICTANIHIDTDEERYWRQVRVQAAIAAMGGITANETFTQLDCNEPGYNKWVAKTAVNVADSLIEELKKGETNGH